MRFLKLSLAWFYAIAAFFWSMPESFPLRSPVIALAEKPFRLFGLWQGWNMFAPNPISEDIFVSAIATFQDGERAEWEISRMNDMDYLTRYRAERWRKFCNDNLRLDSNKHLWPDAAHWFADQFAKESEKPVQRIELIRHWHPAAVPPSATTASRSTWNHYTFYTETIGH